MPTGSRYDVIVVGTNLSGLVTAGYLSQQGKHVLVVDGEEFPRRRPGLPPEALYPAPWTFNSLLLRPLLRELSFHPLEVQRFEEINPTLQVLTPTRRFSLYREEMRFLRELDREYPGQRETAAEAYRECASVTDRLLPFLKDLGSFPPQGWRDRLSYRGFVRKHKIGDLLRRCEKVRKEDCSEEGVDWGRLRQAFFSVFSDGALPKAYPAAWLDRSFFLSRQNSCRLRGDWDELRQTFYKKITIHGGVIAEANPVRRIRGNREGVCGVVLSRSDQELLGARAVVVNGNPQALTDLLDGGPTPKIEAFLSKLRPLYRRHYFQLVVYANYLPAGMEGDLLLIADLKAPFCGENFILVECCPERLGHAYSSGEKVLLTCSYLAPADLATAPDEVEKKVRACVYDALPYLERGMVWDSRTLKRSENKTVFSDSPLLEEVVYPLPSSTSFETPLHDFATPWPRLYLTGRSVFPALGRDGELLAGRLLAERLQRDLARL